MSPAYGQTRQFCNRAEAYEANDDVPLSPADRDTIGDIILKRYSRRDMMRGTLGVAAAAALFGPAALASRNARAETAADRFNFAEVAAGVDETHHVADGYQADILLRWGDPLFPDSPAFDPLNQSAAAQLKQFGYNNDYVAFIPIGENSDRGMLCVNHEYTNEEVMFPRIGRQDLTCFPDMTAELVDIEMAAHGVTIVEIARVDGRWRPVRDSKYNRRISPLTTEIERRWPGCRARPAEDKRRSFRRPHPRHAQQLRRRSDALGHLSHLGGEFPRLFLEDQNDECGKPAKGLGGAQAKSYARYGVPGQWQAWGKFHDRFNVDKEPNEPNRFGWIVEIDPFDPHSVPVKHTALGRFCHEGAETVLNKDGRVVVYCGDDTRFEYLYRFVTARAYDPKDSAANREPALRGNVVGGALRRRRTSRPGCRSSSARARSRRKTALRVKPMW